MNNQLFEKVKKKFKQLNNADPDCSVFSPGRINFLGEHLDYNGGTVLPAAISNGIYFCFSKRTDTQCNAFSLKYEEAVQFDITDLKKPTPALWSYFIKGVMSQVQNLNLGVIGFNVVLGSDIPEGAGVASSAALETGIIFGLNALFNWSLTPFEMVKLCQRAENDFIGVQCGIMDMYAAMFGKSDQLIVLDCSAESNQYLPVNLEGYELILFDSGVKHSLASSEYNVRREECTAVLDTLKRIHPEIESFKDVNESQMHIYRSEFPEVLYKRGKYIVDEIGRVNKAIELLQTGDIKLFGRLMYSTHRGLNEEYEVSCRELNFLVEQTMQFASVIGSRLMGGGFGGCTLNIIKTKSADRVVKQIAKAFKKEFSKALNFYPVKIGEGTRLVH